MLSSLLRRVAPLPVLVCVLCWGLGPTQGPVTRAAESAAADSDETVVNDALADAEARAIRKLHLVRPDLIPYPIAYEVCC